jgi:hypothetical protein
MRNTRLVDKKKTVLSVVPVVVQVGAVTAVEVDGRGFDRVVWNIITGACGAGASTLSFKIQNAIATGMANAADQTNVASAGIIKATGASKIACQIDAPVDPARPFMIPVAAVGTDTMVVCVTADLYKVNSSIAGTVTASSTVGSEIRYPVAAAAVETVIV